MSVKVEGKLFGGRPASALKSAAQTVKTKALKMVRDRSRVDKGTMRAGWRVEDRGASNNVQIEISNDVFYARYQEFGTSRIEPMYAATKTIADAEVLFKQELQKELQGELGGTIVSLASSSSNPSLV